MFLEDLFAEHGIEAQVGVKPYGIAQIGLEVQQSVDQGGYGVECGAGLEAGLGELLGG